MNDNDSLEPDTIPRSKVIAACEALGMDASAIEAVSIDERGVIVTWYARDPAGRTAGRAIESFYRIQEDV